MIRRHSYLSSLNDLEHLRQRSPREAFKVVVQDYFLGLCHELICCIQLLRPNLKDSYIVSESKKTACVYTGRLKLSS